MVRSYNPRTSRNKSNKQNWEIASKSVKKEFSVGKAAKQHEVDRMTLTRYMSRKQKVLVALLDTKLINYVYKCSLKPKTKIFADV